MTNAELMAALESAERRVAELERAQEKARFSEEMFHKVFHGSPDAVTITSTETGLFVYANERIFSLTGHRAEEIIGKTTLDLGMWPDAEDRRRMLEALGRDGFVAGLEITLAHRSGETKDCVVYAQVVELRGEPHLLAFTRDISARKLADAEREGLVERLHQAQKMESLGQLAGGVAHDFNNMLSAIMASADLALTGRDESDPANQFLVDIISAAERAADLIRQLLAFSRKQLIEPKVVDLGQLVVGLEPMLVRLIGDNIILRITSDGSDGKARVDPGQMEQIILNLVINARDAMLDGGEVLIEISDISIDDAYGQAHPSARAGDYVMLTVSDTGSGMTMETRAKIFEPLFTTKETGKGTGLGLATVAGIVDQHGGSIEVESELGRGSSFNLLFPRVLGQVETLVSPEGPGPVGGEETVLVVEDEEIVRSVAVRILERLGYRVLAARSGSDALTLIKGRGGTIDLLLTDVVMPGINGRELARQLSAGCPGLRVLYTSGYNQEVIAPHGVLDEGLQFLAKPYSVKSLAMKVREVLDSPDQPGAV